MTSLYRVNYSLRAHRRDAFIEFIKSLMLTPFVLHTRPKHAPSFTKPISSSSMEFASTEAAEDEHYEEDNETIKLPQTQIVDKNVDRYCELLLCVENLIENHIHHQKTKTEELSRLSQLVPTIGRFFTPLPLKDAFLQVEKKRSLASRRYVPPSFNDIRWILNMAQVSAISSSLRLITFDGDQTLYSDGADFAKDSILIDLLVKLLLYGVNVGIVTAAGYPGDAKRYEQRLSGLLEGLKNGNVGEGERGTGKFYVLGGESNYLFTYSPKTHSLTAVAESTYLPQVLKDALPSNGNRGRIADVLDIAQQCLEECATGMRIEDRCKILRKERAVGVIAQSGCRLSREQLDEFALAVQKRVTNYQHYMFIQQSLNHEYPEPIPFCAFNGGSDVWFDIGNKLVGVQILQKHLGTHGHETLHVGDQFLSTGNDFATRSACCTVWITNPEETAEVLIQLDELLGKRSI